MIIRIPFIFLYYTNNIQIILRQSLLLAAHNRKFTLFSMSKKKKKPKSKLVSHLKIEPRSPDFQYPLLGPLDNSSSSTHLDCLLAYYIPWKLWVQTPNSRRLSDFNSQTHLKTLSRITLQAFLIWELILLRDKRWNEVGKQDTERQKEIALLQHVLLIFVPSLFQLGK